MAAERAPSQAPSFHHRNAPSVARLVAQQISTGCLGCFPCFPMFAKNWRNVSSNCPWHSHSVKFLFRCFVSGRHKNCRTESKCRDGEPNWPDFSFFAQSLEKYSIPSHSFDPLVVYKISRAIWGRFSRNKPPTLQIQTVFPTPGRSHRSMAPDQKLCPGFTSRKVVFRKNVKNLHPGFRCPPHNFAI